MCLTNLLGGIPLPWKLASRTSQNTSPGSQITPMPVAGSQRYGNVPITWTRFRSRFGRKVFLSTYVKLTTQQVAVKSLLVYTSDTPDETSKKNKVSTSMNV